MAFLNNDGLERVLNGLKNVFARTVHVHDDRYYTETEISRMMANKNTDVNLSVSEGKVCITYTES